MKATSYQAVVAQYHVESSDDEQDGGDHAHEHDGLMNYHQQSEKWHQPLWGESHQSFAMNAISSEEDDEDVVRAREELDGLRQPSRPFNPLTIIQVKNAERNVDNSENDTWWKSSNVLWNTSSYHQYRSMPTRRRFFLTASLLAGCLTMIGLTAMWALPSRCNSDEMVCQVQSPSAVRNRLRRETYWTKSYDNITLTSGLEVVEDRETLVPVVVSGFSNNLKSSSYGLLALRPQDGTELWRRELQAKPHRHDCNLIDVNQDGLRDCIVVGHEGLLTAIDPKTGGEIWHMRYHMPLVNISLPRLLPDLDGDGMSEMIAACAVTFPSEMTDNHVHIRTNFILISGRTGGLLGRPYLVDSCTDIGAINVTSNLALQFDCTSQHGPDQFEMTLDEFYSKATNQPSRDFVLTENIAGRAAKYRQFDVIGENPSHTVKDSIHLDWVPLKPHCPECGVTVKMWDSFAHRLLWHRTWPRAVAFQPLSTRYETERPDSPIEGFVFRLWQWEPDVGDTFTVGKNPPEKTYQEQGKEQAAEAERPSSPTSLSTPSSASISQKEPEELNSDEEEEEEEESMFTLYSGNNEMSSAEDESESRRYTPPYEVVINNLIPFGRPNLRGLLSYKNKQSYYNSVQPVEKPAMVSTAQEKSENLAKSKDTLTERVLRQQRWRVLNVTETIYYATLNHSSPQVIPLFSHNLLQKCVQKMPFQPYQCHPHFDTMPNSMVILEHSQDGPDWRDVLFVTNSLVPSSMEKGRGRIAGEATPTSKATSTSKARKLRTSLHRLKLSKDIQRVAPAN